MYLFLGKKAFTHTFTFQPYFFNYTQMNMAHLSRTSPNTSSIGEVSDRLGKIFLTSLVGYHWATGGLRVNQYSVKGGLIIFPLFLLEGNAILPMTPKADCAPGSCSGYKAAGSRGMAQRYQYITLKHCSAFGYGSDKELLIE